MAGYAAAVSLAGACLDLQLMPITMSHHTKPVPL